MLAPEIINFPPPKVVTTQKRDITLQEVINKVDMNSFYKSIIVTCPDELQTNHIEELLTEDTDHYKVFNCPLQEFFELSFINNFVKKGSLHCLSADKNCIIDNCAAITPDGILTLHVLDYVFQALGFEGTKRLHNYYEVKFDLKNVGNIDKIRRGLSKMELCNFLINWEPHDDSICPSSIAKYFHDKSYEVSVQNVEFNKLSPFVDSIPSIADVDMDELVEWIGMLAIGGDMAEKEMYISTYRPPESDHTIESNRISVLIAKGMFTPTIINCLCNKLAEYVMTRQLENYWASISVQSCDNSLWQWCKSSPRMFQSQDCTLTVFFTRSSQHYYSIGQLKYT